MSAATAPKPKATAKAKPKAPAKGKAPAPVSDARITHASELFKQMGDPTRLRIVRELAVVGEISVMGLVERLGDQSQPAVSHHLALMRHARIISFRRDGKNNLYKLATPDGERAAEIAALALKV